VIRYGGKTQCPRCDRTLRIWISWVSEDAPRRIQGSHHAAVACLCGYRKSHDANQQADAVDGLVRLLHPKRRKR